MTARSYGDEAMLEQALAWQAALEQDDADWDGYMTWLESDTRHRAAFDSVALVSATVDRHREDVADLLAAQAPAEPYRRRFWRPFVYAGGAIAATLALMVSMPALRGPATQSYSADGGASRTLALANGIQVTLSPASRIVVCGSDAGQIEVARGEAYFDVRHDPARMLTVTAGGYSISDIGTRFAVNVAGDAFRIGVSDGAVSVASASLPRPVQLVAGRQFAAQGNSYALSVVAPADVGSWRGGRLSYTDAPLGLVASDIMRYSGKTITVDPSLEKVHFSGTLVIGNGSTLLSDLSTVMALETRPDGDGLHIGPAAR